MISSSSSTFKNACHLLSKRCSSITFSPSIPVFDRHTTASTPSLDSSDSMASTSSTGVRTRGAGGASAPPGKKVGGQSRAGTLGYTNEISCFTSLKFHLSDARGRFKNKHIKNYTSRDLKNYTSRDLKRVTAIFCLLLYRPS